MDLDKYYKHMNDYRTALGVLERLEKNAEDDQSKAWLYAAKNAVETAKGREYINPIQMMAKQVGYTAEEVRKALKRVGEAFVRMADSDEE